jgi:hypothetical protein
MLLKECCSVALSLSNTLLRNVITWKETCLKQHFEVFQHVPKIDKLKLIVKLSLN